MIRRRPSRFISQAHTVPPQELSDPQAFPFYKIPHILVFLIGQYCFIALGENDGLAHKYNGDKTHLFA